MNIKDFCTKHGIGRFSYNRMRDAGWGPVETRRPGSSIVKITPKAEQDWTKLQSSSKAQAQIARERERKTAQSKIAGQLAAQALAAKRAKHKRAAR
jgi:hypothetical protein